MIFITTKELYRINLTFVLHTRQGNRKFLFENEDYLSSQPMAILWDPTSLMKTDDPEYNAAYSCTNINYTVTSLLFLNGILALPPSTSSIVIQANAHVDTPLSSKASLILFL